MVDLNVIDEKIIELQGIMVLIDNKSLLTAAISGLLASSKSSPVSILDNIAFSALIVSLVASILAMWPRTLSGENEVSWPNLANMGAEDIEKAFSSSNRSSYLLSQRVLSLSKICATKVIFIKISYIAILVACVMFVLNSFS
jgi:Family of unknown function (DUF5706)